MQMMPVPSTDAPDASLGVALVDTHQGFRALRSEWEALCLQDPDAHAFLSWDWLDTAFRDNALRWSLLVVRDAETATCVAILPLSYRTRWSGSGKIFQSELKAGGRLLLSPFTGFLCAPSHEAAAITALARHLCAMPWAKLSLLYATPVPRIEALARALEAEGCETKWKRYFDRDGATDKLVNAVFPLPASFTAVMENLVSPELAQRYVAWRKLRQPERQRLSLVTSDGIDAALDALGALEARIGASAEGRVARYAPLLRAAASNAVLFMPLLWDNDAPVAAAPHIFDPDYGDMIRLFPLAEDSPAGHEALALLTLYALEWAFANDGIDFHFGREPDPSATLLPTARVESRYLSVRRRNADPEMSFDMLSLGEAVAILRGFIEAGDTDDAIAACAQIERILQA
ncbi:GNAT family N-acetyltransferase [Roseivivax sp. CAU 1753]